MDDWLDVAERMSAAMFEFVCFLNEWKLIELLVTFAEEDGLATTTSMSLPLLTVLRVATSDDEVDSCLGGSGGGGGAGWLLLVHRELESMEDSVFVVVLVVVLAVRFR